MKSNRNKQNKARQNEKITWRLEIFIMTVGKDIFHPFIFSICVKTTPGQNWSKISPINLI